MKIKILFFLFLISFSLEKMELTSPDIDPDKEIPLLFTPFGENINPSFKWYNIPKNTESLAFSIEDPDAPNGLFCHWILINIDININEIKQNSIIGKQIKNNFGKKNYGGPNPPKGQVHNYHFVLYALNKKKIKVKNCKEFKEVVEKYTIEKSEIVAKFKSKIGQLIKNKNRKINDL